MLGDKPQLVGLERHGLTRLPGRSPKKKAAGKEHMRIAVGAAQQYVAACFHAVAAANQSKVVGKFMTFAVGQGRQQHISIERAKAVDFKLRSARIDRNDVEAVVDELAARF